MPNINDTFDEHDNQSARLSVMTQEQIKLADKIMDWYRDAYMEKDDRGIFEKMEAAELYWEGEANPPESDNDPASNTNIVNSTIEGQVAYLVEQNIAIEAKARGPSDLPFRNKAVNLMEWCKDQNKMRRKLDVHERRRKKFGTGIFRVLFEPDMLDGLGLPWIEPVNPAYVFPDPVISDIYKIQQGRFLIESINRSIESAREQFGDELADAITPGYTPMEYADMFDEFDGDEGLVARDHYLHWLVWTHAWVDEDFGIESQPADVMISDDEDALEADAEDTVQEKSKKKVLRLIEMSADGVILRDTLEQGVLICEDDNRYPYFFTPDMYREGTVWAKSTAELLIPQQDIIDDLDDQIRINARLTGNPQREVAIESGIDPDKIDNAGGTIYPSNIPNGMRYINPPEIPQYIQKRRDQAFQERTIVSRWSDQMNGIRQSGADTATEVLTLQQGGTQSITHDKMLLEETLAEVFEYCLVLMMENYTETEIFRITEQGEESFMSLNPSHLRNIPVLMPATDSYQQMMTARFPEAQNIPEWMSHPEGLTQRIALDIEVKVGAGLPSNKAFVFQMLQQANQARAITPQEYRHLLRDYVGLPIPETPPAPPMMPGPMGEGLPAGLSPDVAGLAQSGAPAPPMPGVVA